MKLLNKIVLFLFGLASFSLGSTPIKIVGDAFPVSMEGDIYMTPKWSPKGDVIAVSGPIFQGIYLVTFPLGNVKLLTDKMGSGYGFSWSHDGARIASRTLTFVDMRRLNELMVFDVETNESTSISSPQSLLPGTPFWTKSDEHVFMNAADSPHFYATNPLKTEKSKDDVYFISNQTVFNVNDDKGIKTSLFEMQSPITSFAVSPDETKIVFSTSGQNFWVSDIDGANRVSLGKGLAPSWSPDGRWICYMITEDDGHNMLESDIYVIRVNGDDKKNITQTPNQIEMHPDWSPNGEWIAFDTDQGQILVQQVEGK